MKDGSKRAKRIRYSPLRAGERTKIIWLSAETNDRLKEIKEKHKFGAAEDVVIYLLRLYYAAEQTKEEK
jgi:hypothetical protein